MSHLINNGRTLIGDATTCLQCGKQVRLRVNLGQLMMIVAVEADDEDQMHTHQEASEAA